MTEQVADELYANSSSEQMHRERVPQAVSIARNAQVRGAHMLRKNVADRGAQQWAIRTTCPQEELGMCPALSFALDRKVLA